MHYNNDHWHSELGRESANEKLRTKSFWQRYRWFIIALSTLVVLVVILASTTVYLFVNCQDKNQLPRPSTPVVQIPLTPTPTNSDATVTPQPTDTPIPTTKTYQENRALTCILGCSNDLGFVLNKVVVDLSNESTTWYFTIKNKGASVCPTWNTTAYVEINRGQNHRQVLQEHLQRKLRLMLDKLKISIRRFNLSQSQILPTH